MAAPAPDGAVGPCAVVAPAVVTVVDGGEVVGATVGGGAVVGGEVGGDVGGAVGATVLGGVVEGGTVSSGAVCTGPTVDSVVVGGSSVGATVVGEAGGFAVPPPPDRPKAAPMTIPMTTTAAIAVNGTHRANTGPATAPSSATDSVSSSWVASDTG